MTWAEFQIRLFAFNRMQKEEWHKVNFLSNTIISVAPYLKGTEKNKIMKSNYNALFGNAPKKINKAGLELLKKQQEEYHNRHKK